MIDMTEHPATYDCDGCGTLISSQPGTRNDMLVIAVLPRPGASKFGDNGPDAELYRPAHFHDMKCLEQWAAQWREKSDNGAVPVFMGSSPNEWTTDTRR